MEWNFTNLVIQTLAGAIGGNLISMVAKEFSFGFLARTLVGALTGGLSGAFLQTIVATTVTEAGNPVGPTLIEQLILQSLAGAAVGGIAVMIVGFIGDSYYRQNKSNNS
jgi:hypothetical protein